MPVNGVCIAFTDTALEENPDWTRLDDPDGYRPVTGWQIQRGRNSETDKTVTGTATVFFADNQGLLDPTNIFSPFFGNLDPMKQAKIDLQNPVTEEWSTLFRGHVHGPDHELEMFVADTQGLDVITYQLVDAFDLFANIILTRGKHGNSTGLVDFPNIYYEGTPSNVQGVADVEVHVDVRIAQLLDDAGWANTGETREGLRNIFSGNVTVQGAVYSRQDSLLQALFEAADAEFPGIANLYMSKDGIVTFHGRYARFFPDRAGYGINNWYVGGLAEAQADATVAPFVGPLRFYRSATDIINASYALPLGVDETDSGVLHASDPTSQATFGYRSENFNNLLTAAGHNDDSSTTTAVEECNKFSDYIVGNYKDPKTRIGTLTFKGRSPGTIGAAALWDLMCNVEIGDVISLTTAHVDQGGFDENWYVEKITYTAQPGRTDMHDITLQLEVSPATLFEYNPFGSVDTGES